MPILSKKPNQKLNWFSRYLFVPPDVNPKSLLSNGKLLDDATIKSLDTKIAALAAQKQLNELGRWGKKELGIPYGIIKGKHALYAIYNEDKNQHQGGAGKDATIKWAQNLTSGEWCAVKTIKLYPEEDASNFEFKALMSLGKTNESSFIRARNPQTLALAKEDDAKKNKKINYVISYEKGLSLIQLAWNRNRNPNSGIYTWPDLLWLEISLKVLQATQSVHKKEIYHNDINFGNYIFNIADDTLVPLDFGHSCSFSNNSKNICSVPRLHSAPELRKKEQAIFTHTEETEVYALGMMLKQILFNTQPYDPVNPPKEYLSWDKGYTSFITDQAILDYTRKMTAIRRSERPELNECIEFFSAVLKQYKKTHPDEVATVARIKQEAKEHEAQRLQEIGVLEELTIWEKVWEVVKVAVGLLVVAAVLSAAIYFSLGAASIAIPWLATFETLPALAIGKGIIFSTLASIAAIGTWIYSRWTGNKPAQEVKEIKEAVSSDLTSSTPSLGGASNGQIANLMPAVTSQKNPKETEEKKSDPPPVADTSAPTSSKPEYTSPNPRNG